jgi:RimJ/RimL family protein N-acetyltransferase
MSDSGPHLTPFVLAGNLVRLEPLSPDHADDLTAAATENRSSYGFTRVPDGRAETATYIAEAIASQGTGRTLPFAVRRISDGRVVGSTRFLDMEHFTLPPPWPPGASHGEPPSDAAPPSVAEIGSTWYAASAQRTGINVECKILLLTHAFEAWKTLRVTLKTDARNLRSRTAIERLGARFEGIRRVHTIAVDGAIRDSAYYSIIAAEWPEVRANLLGRLSAAGG